MHRNQDNIFKAFSWAYSLGTVIVLGMLFSLYHFAGAFSLVFIFILALIFLGGLLGIIRPDKNRLIAAAVMVLLTIVAVILLSVYINLPVYQTYNLILILGFYFLLGFFPAMQWTENTLGKMLTAGLAVLMGSLIYNIIAIITVICLGVTIGAFVAIFISFILIVSCYLLQKKEGGMIDSFIHRNNPISEDLQILSVILMALLINALFLNYQYPHWHTDHYFTFVKTLFNDDIFNIGRLPGNMAQTAHILSLFVPPVWAKLLHFDIAAATYFELLVGHLGLYVSVYIFSKMLFKKHKYALGSLIFVAFLSELHLYSWGLKSLLNHGDLAQYFPLTMDAWRSFLVFLRSRLLPLFHPWALTSYIDIAKGYSSLLLCIYIVFRRDKDLSALIFVGIIAIIIMGCGEEYLLFTFLTFIFIYLWINYRQLQSIKIIAGLLIGVIIGFPVYFYLSASRGALNMIGHGSVFVKKLNEAGVYLFTGEKLSLNWSSIGYLLLDFVYPIFFIVLFVIYKYILPKREIERDASARLIFALFLNFGIMIFIPIFLGSKEMMNWNLNRFLAPLMFWLYILAGASFVYVVSTRFKTNVAIITLLLLLGIFPTIRLAYTSLIFEPIRIVDGVNMVLLPDGHQASPTQIIKMK